MYQESEKVELKECFVEKIKHEILAFLNSNGGVIYVGVKDNGELVGIPNDKKDEYDSTISSWIRDCFYPNINQYINFFYNQDNVLVVEVKSGSNKPYYLTEKGPKPSGVYIRIGRSTRQATQDEIIQMMVDSRDYSYEKEVAENQNLKFTDFEIIAKKNDLEFNPKKMETLGISRNGRFTNLGLLVSDQNPIVVKFAVYKDKTRTEFKVKKEFEGSIVKIADQLLEYSNLYNDVSAKIVDYQPQRIETKNYPGVALREAIVNAICHADYTKNSNIKVEFFIDRVEILSPGGLYGGVSLEDILAGRQITRNPGIVNIFNKLGIIENYGTGIERMFESYTPYNLKPFIDSSNSFFVVKLANVNYGVNQNDTQNETQNETQKETQKSIEYEIINIIKNNNNITRKEIAEKLGKSLSTIARVIGESKKIKYVGSSKAGHWEIQ